MHENGIEFDMGELADLIQAHGYGIAADINQTGGNTATIYAYVDGIGAANNPAHPYVSVGPGTFDWYDPRKSEGSLDELSATQHPGGYDTDGRTEFFRRGQTLAQVAEKVVALVRSMTTKRGIDDLLERFPNASPHWGSYGVDIPWMDCNLIITLDGEGDEEYTLGLYVGDGWHEAREPEAVAIVKGAAHVLAIVDHLTEQAPSGIEWADWAVPAVALIALCENQEG